MRLVAPAVLALGLLAGCGDGGPTSLALEPTTTTDAVDPRTRPDVGVVVEVLDGDTADIEIGGVVERVRFIGIDTPEPPGGNRPAECWGAEASERTRALLPPGTLVRLERDAEARDPYDRLLAYVHRLDDDLFVNLQLVEEGMAGTLRIEPNTTFAPDFAAAADRAAAAGAGFWGACGGDDVPLDG